LITPSTKVKPSLTCPELLTLRTRRGAYARQALEPSSRRAYESRIQSYVDFCHRIHAPPFPISSDTFTLYATYYVHDQGCKEAGLSQSLAALRYYHQAHDLPWLSDSELFHVQQLRKGLRKVFFQPRTPKFAVTAALISSAAACLEPDANFTHLQFLALCHTGHSCLLRTSEILSARAGDLTFHPCPAPDSSQPPGFDATLSIRASKMNKAGPPEVLTIPFHGPESTSMLLYRYAKAYRAHFASAFPLSLDAYLFPTWATSPAGAGPSPRRPLPRALLQHALRTFFPQASATPHSGFSFRAGGATDLADLQVPHQLIKSRGRWKSDAYLLYIKLDPSRDRDALALAFKSLLDQQQAISLLPSQASTDPATSSAAPSS
jgi:hypothetical protein